MTKEEVLWKIKNMKKCFICQVQCNQQCCPLCPILSAIGTNDEVLDTFDFVIKVLGETE